MFLAALTLGPLAVLAFGAPAQPTSESTSESTTQSVAQPAVQSTAAVDEHFPASTALAESVSPDTLKGLSQLVQGFVDDGEIVGAELLVIKNGHSILHESFGWRDREAGVAMENDSVFCVRSMTKPVIAAAILMLVEDRLIKLDHPVAEYLPAFDVDGSREITVEHLLTHTSGLTMSLLLGKNLRDLDGIQAVAQLGAGYELDFEPGSALSYSDQGTDTLTALIEVVTGAPAADFVRTRVLDPLGMHDSACVMTEEHPLRERGCCKYLGSPGEWTRFWSPDEPPLFPFFLGSQGLYSTLEDYARFMEFWQRKGRAGSERLLRSRSVNKALSPSPYPLGSPTGLPGLRCDYGFLMQLWTAEGEGGENDEREVVAFGHTGSDGTHAWVFPKQKAIVLYFTQSRGTLTGLRVEEVLGELFLGVPFDPNQAAPPLEQYLGYYWEGAGDLYRAIIRDGDDLALEIMSKGVVPLTYVGEDRWKLRPNPSLVLEFDRSEEGVVTGYHIGDHQEFRFEPSSELPSVDEIAQRVRKAHRLDLLEKLGPIRMSGKLSMEKLGVSGDQSALYAWPDRFRIDTVMGDNFENMAFDGEQVWYASMIKPVGILEGRRGEIARLDNHFAHFGDWSRWYPKMQVIQVMGRSDATGFVVRAGDTSAPATTLYIDEKTGRVRQVDSLTDIDGMGRIGYRAVFGDFRDVSGMLLPFRTEVQLANPLIGTVLTTVEDYELGVEVPEGTFELRD